MRAKCEGPGFMLHGVVFRAWSFSSFSLIAPISSLIGLAVIYGFLELRQVPLESECVK